MGWSDGLLLPAIAAMALLRYRVIKHNARLDCGFGTQDPPPPPRGPKQQVVVELKYTGFKGYSTQSPVTDRAKQTNRNPGWQVAFVTVEAVQLHDPGEI